VKFFDYDNDGNLDLFIANGHPDDKIEAHSSHVHLQGGRCCYSTTTAAAWRTSVALPARLFLKASRARGMGGGKISTMTVQ